MRLKTSAVILSAAAMLSLAACGSSDEAMKDDMKASASTAAGSAASTSPSAGSETMLPGAYLTKAEYESQMTSRASTKVVYFFHASWCPDCKQTEESLTKDGVPAGLTVVKVDYDTATDLKEKYGITQQHTFVQVDASGGQLAKWSGTHSGAEIKAKTV